MILYGYMARILIEGKLTCLECDKFEETGNIVVIGRRVLSPIVVEGLLGKGIGHGEATRHMKFSLTVRGETNTAILDYGGGMSAISPIVLEDGRVTL